MTNISFLNKATNRFLTAAIQKPESVKPDYTVDKEYNYTAIKDFKQEVSDAYFKDMSPDDKDPEMNSYDLTSLKEGFTVGKRGQIIKTEIDGEPAVILATKKSSVTSRAGTGFQPESVSRDVVGILRGDSLDTFKFSYTGEEEPTQVQHNHFALHSTSSSVYYLTK